ncbi:unnamed protein product [Ambrosiozyma monospora]|uniref:Unnamed protein product n=1 Tax=Ambrosiozyma monospora TaxID=43982 RepID=A0A9W6YSB9_AMBMO|nr:unnamed protein product [Ambrosiozyma monospora]
MSDSIVSEEPKTAQTTPPSSAGSDAPVVTADEKKQKQNTQTGETKTGIDKTTPPEIKVGESAAEIGAKKVVDSKVEAATNVPAKKVDAAEKKPTDETSVEKKTTSDTVKSTEVKPADTIVKEKDEGSKTATETKTATVGSTPAVAVPAKSEVVKPEAQAVPADTTKTTSETSIDTKKTLEKPEITKEQQQTSIDNPTPKPETASQAPPPPPRPAASASTLTTTTKIPSNKPLPSHEPLVKSETIDSENMESFRSIKMLNLLNPSNKIGLRSILEADYLAQHNLHQSKTISLKVITWNVAQNSSPNLNLFQQLLCTKDDTFPDLFLFNFQETISLRSLSHSDSAIIRWCVIITNTLNKLTDRKYSVVSKSGLLGLTTIIVADAELSEQISEIEVNKIGLVSIIEHPSSSW